MDEERIKEFFYLDEEEKSCVVKLVLFDRLKEDFDVEASQEDFDFLVDNRDLIDVKYGSQYFSYKQLRQVSSNYKNNEIDNLYILTRDDQKHPYHDLLTKIKTYETPIGTFTLYSVDIPKLLSRYGDLIQNY